MTTIIEIKKLLDGCSMAQKRAIFSYLRKDIKIHPIEDELNIQAEMILEAINRSNDLIKRGIRGIIAEAAFDAYIIGSIKEWRTEPIAGNQPYDHLLSKGSEQIKIQVKMQRLKNKIPMFASEGYRFLSLEQYVVETQKTRGGITLSTGEQTRPYRFGEFDILAVSMHPSTNDWKIFYYTVANWLIPDRKDPKLLLKFQPVSKIPNDDWTSDIYTVINWYKSNIKKTIKY